MSALEPIVIPGRLPERSAISHSRLVSEDARERPVVRLVAFAALALYGALRWGTLMKPQATWRLLGLVALAAAIFALGAVRWPAKLSAPWLRRALLAAVVILVLGALFALAGVPVSWLYRLRIALTWQGISGGLQALPGTLVPYLGINPWVRIVIVLGAGGLLLGSALTVALPRRLVLDVRLACSALLLTALAVIPSIIMLPRFPYAQGLLLFALVAALLWGERVASRRSGPALALIAATGIFAALLAPALHSRSWLNYQTLTNGLAPSNLESFNWAQGYGPYTWPRHQREVLTVKAARADYWKAADLDVFNGFGWAQGGGPVSSSLPGPSVAALKRWTESLTVTITGMKTIDVIAAGAAQRPAHIGAVDQTQSLGTWVASGPLHSGQTYTVKTYSPRPTAAELAAIPAAAYPDAPLADYRVVGLPASSLAHYNLPEVEFPTFHSGGPALNLSGPYGTDGVALVTHSPYARAYALARTLAAGAPTPYAFVAAVLRHLSPTNGFRYDEHVASARFPLETFLFQTHRGYCQHFAGAMALLLRLGGLPARVATGFTAGTFNSATGSFAVTDRDAHAWVEVWFPRYGWVRFDPTPAAAPAFADSANSGVLLGAPSLKPGAVTARRQGNLGGLGPGAARSGRGGIGLWVYIPLALALIIAAVLALRAWRRPASAERLTSELELALRRCGRPARDGLTLHALEQRFRASAPAVSYLRRLRLARYGRVSELPTGAQRRALRTQLAAGLGFGGWLRSWWALPPRRLRAPDS